MTKLKVFLHFLTSLLFHKTETEATNTKEETPMSEPTPVAVDPVTGQPVVTPAVAAPATQTAADVQTASAAVGSVEAKLEAFAAQLKPLLKAAGHDIEVVYDDLVAVAKKLI